MGDHISEVPLYCIAMDSIVLSVFYCIVFYCIVCSCIVLKYSGTSLIRSPTGRGKSDLNGEVTLLQGANLHGGIFGTEQG